MSLDEGHLKKLVHVGAIFIFNEQLQSLNSAPGAHMASWALHKSAFSQEVFKKSCKEIYNENKAYLREKS